ncbi:MAG: glucoamylase family protein [Bryobacteraceae bacterium]|nr:glucoamylase family protein [Bryobacteraceae bacterium]
MTKLRARIVRCSNALERCWRHWDGRPAPAPAATWLFENRLYLRSHVREVSNYLPSMSYRTLPQNEDGLPCAYDLAGRLWRELGSTVEAESLAAALWREQQQRKLKMGEVWALGALMRLVILEDLADFACQEKEQEGSVSDHAVCQAVMALRALGALAWKELFEQVSVVEAILRADPSGVYPRMDFATRDHYRHVVEDFAQYSGVAEEEVAQRVIQQSEISPGELQRHVGYWLIDEGAKPMREILGYRAPRSGWLPRAIQRHPEFFYLGGIEIATFVVMALLLSQLHTLTPQAFAVFLLFLPATGAAASMVNQWVTSLIRPQLRPKMDFSETGIPEDARTMVVVPTLLLSKSFAAKLLEDLEVRYLANRDPQLTFALLTDFPDAPEPAAEDSEIVEICAAGIERLNEKYPGAPFYLFHRAREWNPKQFSFMGWERKRGKLIHFNNLLRGHGDEFSVKVGHLDVLPTIRYVITLDTDTQLPRDSARRLIETICHPLNRPVIDPESNTVRRGYGILQPRVGISVDSAGRSRLARIYSGQTGIDLYTTAVSDVYQDLFGEGIYTGKGLYDVEVFDRVLTHRFPHDALLSHDLIEGLYARAALVSDVEVIDDYPSHYGAWTKRKHRWVRGDWQLLLWLLPRVPGYDGRFARNPLGLVARWKIFDNLRRSALEIGTFLLLNAAWWFLPGGPQYWTLAVLVLLALPVWVEFGRAWRRWPKAKFLRAHVRDSLAALATGHFNALLLLTFLAHQSLLMLDAIVRTIARTITGRRLLEWESAAEAERRGSLGYLWMSAFASAGLAFALAAARPEAMPWAAGIVALWIGAPAAAAWLNAAGRAPRSLKERDREFLEVVGRRTWNYFETFERAEDHWIAPDNWQREPELTARRTSPTNLGLQLNAQLAAVDLGFLTIAEFVERAGRTMTSIARLERFQGHLFNWYDTQALEPLWPRYVSTVDSGNFVASMIAFAEGCRELAAVSEDLSAPLTEMAETAQRWVAETDFGFLYDPKKKLLSIGYDVAAARADEYQYDLLASEARTASFLAIAKGDVPKDHWFHLGRTLALYAGQRVLLSWSGTMFEYLMPLLWMRTWPGTLLDRAARGIVACQRSWARRRAVPWGVSECAYSNRDESGSYQYFAFGLPEVALRRTRPDELVIAPYATALALACAPCAAVSNLRRMEAEGWLDEYGFVDAVEYRGGTAIKVEAYMAHHQGMTLTAIANALCDNAMQRRFHAEPMVQATELLLHERVPSTAWLVRPEPPAPEPGLPASEAAHAGAEV